jgi:hypothetical protein
VPDRHSQRQANTFVNQIVFADVVYVRDFTKAEAMDDEQLKHLAAIALTCYGSFDLAAHCLFRLAERRAVGRNAVELFMNSVSAAARCDRRSSALGVAPSPEVPGPGPESGPLPAGSPLRRTKFSSCAKRLRVPPVFS